MFSKKTKMFCERRNITYLPSKKNYSSCHKLDGDEFKKVRIEESAPSPDRTPEKMDRCLQATTTIALVLSELAPQLFWQAARFLRHCDSQAVAEFDYFDIDFNRFHSCSIVFQPFLRGIPPISAPFEKLCSLTPYTPIQPSV